MSAQTEYPGLPVSCKRIRPATLDVFDALAAVHHRTGRATVRAVALEADRSTSATHLHLRRLRKLGMADWWPAHEGTLRPTVRVVAAQ